MIAKHMPNINSLDVSKCLLIGAVKPMRKTAEMISSQTLTSAEEDDGKEPHEYRFTPFFDSPTLPRIGTGYGSPLATLNLSGCENISAYILHRLFLLFPNIRVC